MNERVLLQMLHVELCLEILTIFTACSPGLVHRSALRIIFSINKHQSGHHWQQGRDILSIPIRGFLYVHVMQHKSGLLQCVSDWLTARPCQSRDWWLYANERNNTSFLQTELSWTVERRSWLTWQWRRQNWSDPLTREPPAAGRICWWDLNYF